jgi:hypothetical protein
MKSKKIRRESNQAARKLSLNRETIRRLDNHELEQVAGGLPVSKLLAPQCDSNVAVGGEPICEDPG